MSLLSWLFVPKCAVCGERLDHDKTVPLCNKCLLDWEREKLADCPNCGQKVENCWCGIPQDKRHYIYAERHLSYYSSHRDSVTKRIVFSIKRKKNLPVFDMLADELAEAVRFDFPVNGDFILVNVPRSRASVTEYGFDQSLILCKKISLRLGIPVNEVLVHKGEGIQKSLDTKLRVENARKSYFIDPQKKEIVKGKKVILVDDIVTTGATVSRCAMLVKRAGAERVYVLSIAKTF